MSIKITDVKITPNPALCGETLHISVGVDEYTAYGIGGHMAAKFVPQDGTAIQADRLVIVPKGTQPPREAGKIYYMEKE